MFYCSKVLINISSPAYFTFLAEGVQGTGVREK
jgi:hypothetical protein